LVYVEGLGCVPLESVPCTLNYYRDPSTKTCLPVSFCGDEESGMPAGTGFKYKLEGTPPKCVSRCPPGTFMDSTTGGKCVTRKKEDKKKAEGGILAQLLLGAGAGFAVGGPVGAGVGAIAAVALFGKK
jgi:hypothetical protein